MTKSTAEPTSESSEPSTEPSPEPKKRGRPSLGPRVGIHVSLPREFYQDVAMIAAQDGLPMGRVISRLVAQALGKEAPAWTLPPVDNQEELPLPDAS
jgi:hypothetical protein